MIRRRVIVSYDYIEEMSNCIRRIFENCYYIHLHSSKSTAKKKKTNKQTKYKNSNEEHSNSDIITGLDQF